MKKKLVRREEVEKLQTYPILVAVCNGPKTTREISHALLMSDNTVAKHCRALEAEGHIIQRHSDRRWVMRVWLRAEGLPEVVAVPGRPLYIKAGALAGEPVLSPQEADREGVLGTDGSQADPTVPRYTSGALQLSRTYDVPVELMGVGIIRVGKLTDCHSCKTPTRLWWGEHAYCQGCARGWGKGLV